jgi:hypothetical protein
MNNRGTSNVRRGTLKDIRFIVLLSTSYVLLSTLSLHAQGILPPQASTTTVEPEMTRALRIGEKVPESLMVVEESAKERGLLTYKSAIEIMVVGFFSATCPESISRWNQLTRFYNDYKGWGVTFVAINAGSSETRADLYKRLKKADLAIPLLKEKGHSITAAFKIGSVPMLAIIDESGDIRFRGPPGKDARQAIEAVIGHMDAVSHPEPLIQEECSVE